MTINVQQWKKTKEIITTHCQHAADKVKIGTDLAETVLSIAVANRDTEFLKYFLEQMEDVTVLDVGHVVQQCIMQGWVDVLEVLHKSNHVDLFLSADPEYTGQLFQHVSGVKMREYLGLDSKETSDKGI